MSQNNLYLLTEDFYKENNNLIEIMAGDKSRPYFMYHITIGSLEFAIPLRSDIRHKHYFYTGKNEKQEICGIDYTKAVLLSDKKKYVKNVHVWIREEEYKEIRGNEFLIKKNFEKYIRVFKKAYKIVSLERGSDYEKNLCRFSTLQNYIEELEI